MPAPTQTYQSVDELVHRGRKLVRSLLLDEPYTQPELDRSVFVQQVKELLPTVVHPCIDFDPLGTTGMTGDDWDFPNQTELGTDRPPVGALSAARHMILIQLPKHEYPIFATYRAEGGPGRPARWVLETYTVAGLDYETDQLDLAAALSTGDYPERSKSNE